MKINAQNLDYYQLNQAIRQAEGPVVIDHCLGQRFIGTALGAGRSLTIHGVPGNAMGAYLDGGSIEVFGDVQEATGDTMNAGTIVVHGSAGDATGYSMRGGVILIEGDVGYRAGIHMKSFQKRYYCRHISSGEQFPPFIKDRSGEYRKRRILLGSQNCCFEFIGITHCLNMDQISACLLSPDHDFFERLVSLFKIQIPHRF